MASRNENVPVVVYYDAYVADCDDGVEFKGASNVRVSMRRGMTFNALKTKIQHKMGLNRGQAITAVIYQHPIFVGLACSIIRLLPRVMMRILMACSMSITNINA